VVIVRHREAWSDSAAHIRANTAAIEPPAFARNVLNREHTTINLERDAMNCRHFFRSAGLGSVRSRRKRDDHHAPNKAPTSPQIQHELDDEHITINSIESPATAHRSKCWRYVFFTTAIHSHIRSSTFAPHHLTIHKSMHKFDGLFLSNGPGDLTYNVETIEQLKRPR
jgi:hypothetical protein